MKNKSSIVNSIILLVLSAALCMAAYFGSISATEYDLGQLAYLLLIFFPIAAFLIGVLSNTIVGSWWMAPISSLLVFSGFMLVMYKTINITYILIYMLISLLGYYISYILRKIMKRQRKIK